VAQLARDPGRAGRAQGLRRGLVLIGFMGAGKSTVARELAGALGVAALDSDRLLEERLGRPLAQEFELHGEASFRVAEEELVRELLDDAGPGSVIALGGGSVCSEGVRQALESHLTVLLDVDPAVAWARIQPGQGGPAQRPLAREQATFIALHAQRQALYEGLADAFLPALAPGRAPEVLDALSALSAAPAGVRLLWASSASGSYPVLIGRGLLRAGATKELEALWPLDRSASRAFCVTDQTVGAIYAERLGAAVPPITIEPGEPSKTLASAERVWSELAARSRCPR